MILEENSITQIGGKTSLITLTMKIWHLWPAMVSGLTYRKALDIMSSVHISIVFQKGPRR